MVSISSSYGHNSFYERMTVPSVIPCYGFHIAGLVDDLELEVLLDRADWHCIHITERGNNLNTVCGYMRFDEAIPVTALECVHQCIRFSGSRIVIADLVQVLVQCYHRVDARGVFMPVMDDGKTVGQATNSGSLGQSRNIGLFPTHGSPGHLSVARDENLHRLELRRARGRAPSPVMSNFNFGPSIRSENESQEILNDIDQTPILEE